MFISQQTYEGLEISINATIEAVQFLLQREVRYVLTERFSQDQLENYFGRQRSIGGRKDNPAIRDFGYNDNSIRNQKVFRPIAGNVRSIDEATNQSHVEKKQKIIKIIFCSTCLILPYTTF